MSTVLFLLKWLPFDMQEFPLATTNSFICRVYERKRIILWFKKLSLNGFYENDLSLIEVFKSRMKHFIFKNVTYFAIISRKWYYRFS